MTIRLVSIGTLFLNTLAVSAALVIYSYTGVNHFEEGGFITILSVSQLLTIAWLSYKILQARNVTRKYFHWKDSSILWGIISIGFLFLAVDEFFQIHENIDYGIHQFFNMRQTGFSDRIDDITVGLYGLVGIYVFILYKNELKNHRKAFPLFIIGYIFFVAMVAIDLLSNRDDILRMFFDYYLANDIRVLLSHVEDSLKVFAEAFFIIAFYIIYTTTKNIE